MAGVYRAIRASRNSGSVLSVLATQPHEQMCGFQQLYNNLAILHTPVTPAVCVWGGVRQKKLDALHIPYACTSTYTLADTFTHIYKTHK